MESEVRIVNAPDSIFLQYGVDDEIGDIDHNECEEVTWASERIYNTDVHYVRADRLNALEAERDRLRDLLRASWKWVQNEKLYNAIGQALKGGGDE